MTTKALIRRKAHRASRSLTVWFSAAVPVLLAGAETLKDQLPAMGALLSGWRLVAASVIVSAVVTALRVRSTRAEPATPYPALDAPEVPGA